MDAEMTDIVERLHGLIDNRDAEIERLRAQLVSDINAETEIDRLETEIERLREQVRNRDYALDRLGELKDAEIERLRAALRDMIEISTRNSEATLMLIAIRMCAGKALEGK